MRDDRLYLLDILDAAERIHEFIEGKDFRQFQVEELLQSAVLHQISVIGEASCRVSEELQQRYPAVPWREIGGMRNQIIHGYFSLDPEIIWETAVHNVPDLQRQIQEILGQVFPT